MDNIREMELLLAAELRSVGTAVILQEEYNCTTKAEEFIKQLLDNNFSITKIETIDKAPKDGTRVLGLWDNLGKIVCENVHYSEDGFNYNHNWWKDDGSASAATHFMPLPSLPKEGE